VFSDTGDRQPLACLGAHNTRSLDSATPNLKLQTGVAHVRRYAVPPESNQKDGNLRCATARRHDTGHALWNPVLAVLLNPPEPAHDR